ncbi:MAG: hypothetical protein JXB62_01355 [Pirellulales bacterium]|nr:hypothetical protein [Pirellulales bacterium]
MNTKPVFVALVVALASAAAAESRAQLFGDRTVGGSLSRRSRTTTSRTSPGRPTSVSEEIGAVLGNERFIRGNREGASFVGRDADDVAGFVGSQQGVTPGDVATATEGLRIEAAPDANQTALPAALPRVGMYRPRLRIGFAIPPQAPQTVSTELARRLQSCPGLHLQSPIEVYLEGETATLRGAVASERDRSLAQLMVLFEPGISQVRNELMVKHLSLPAAAKAPTVEVPPATGPRF